MAEYINKEEYCENYCRCSKEFCERQSCPIWKAPAADVEPVVRCRDCKYSYEDISGRCCSHGPCKDWVVLDDSFCSQGERMESNADR